MTLKIVRLLPLLFQFILSLYPARLVAASNCEYNPDRFTLCGLPNKGKYNSLFCQDLSCPILHYCPGDGKRYPCTVEGPECCCSDSAQTCVEQAQQLLKENSTTVSRRLQFLPDFSGLSERLDNVTQNLIDSINWTDVLNLTFFGRTIDFISFRNQTNTSNGVATQEPTSSPTTLIIQSIPNASAEEPTSIPSTQISQGAQNDGVEEPTSTPTTLNSPESEEPTSLPTDTDNPGGDVD